MTKPHVHAEQIKAWADGAIIQYKYRNGEWRDTSTALGPMWEPDIEYRVKPEPKPDIVQYHGFYQSDNFPTLFTANDDTYDLPHLISKTLKRGWTLTAIIKTTVDGDTLKVKSIEHISV